MITKEQFLEIYKNISKTIEEGDKLITNPVLNSDYMLDYTGSVWSCLETLLNTIFNKEGSDWFYWWFFEKPYVKDEIKARDKYGNILPTETPEDLWNLINNF